MRKRLSPRVKSISCHRHDGCMTARGLPMQALGERVEVARGEPAGGHRVQRRLLGRDVDRMHGTEVLDEVAGQLARDPLGDGLERGAQAPPYVAQLAVV